ncbi:hypothetical protein K2173_007986 [Erythroxylum novogranatense]|uniref:VQ domain-containing protein n=1 Tax=Erythroxylum novogranatense TaxID=1862640 RepID=A0AAV8T6Z5_9ROSI|nr:hypothetical protein K2173_007986 [Erythroxylum novogranatense]
MDKSCQSSGDSTITTSSSANNNNRDQYLKHLNKLSHKISKPIITKKPPFDETTTLNQPPLEQSQLQPTQHPQNLQAQQHQPPVYNINKNDFRDVVQKLTGSPAHERISNPPPIQPPKPPSSRLQRIRPPPLEHVSNRPPPLLNSAVPPSHQPPLIHGASTSASGFIHRPAAPLSPLPPFPAVHAAAESPISAYMRYLQNSSSAADSSKQFAGFSPLAPLASPRWNNLVPPTQELAPPQTSGMVTSQPPLQLPSSPLPFGCLNSPRSPYPLLSPNLLLSPSSFPLSPTLPVPSPTWRGL